MGSIAFGPAGYIGTRETGYIGTRRGPPSVVIIHFAAGSDIDAAKARARKDGGIFVDATGPSLTASVTIEVVGGLVDSFSMRTASNFDGTGTLDLLESDANGNGIWEKQVFDVNDSAAYLMDADRTALNLAVTLGFSGDPNDPPSRTQGWATLIITFLPP